MGKENLSSTGQPLMSGDSKKKKILVVGAGASGMACTASLLRHPDKFDVTVIEKQDHAGGQAVSTAIDKNKFGAEFLNDGVQGGSEIFAHTFKWMREMGYEPTELDLQISFGKGKDGFWTNVFPSQLVEKYKEDIKKFGKCLRTIRRFELFFAVMPINRVIPFFGLSKGFGDNMVYPLMALFLGTGNQTPNVSAVILERLFMDKNMKLWDYDENTLLPNIPKMYAFPYLKGFYADWVKNLSDKGANFKFQHEVVEVVQRNNKGVTIKYRELPPEYKDPYNTEGGKGPYTTPEQIAESLKNAPVSTEHFDELVMCVLADDALKILGKTATRFERGTLGSVQFYDDITVTHSDFEYMEKHYENYFKEELTLPEEKRRLEDTKKIDFARKNFRPAYYTKSYEQDHTKIEMSFNCTAYQPQFPKDQPLDQSVYQTIFLDNRSNNLWTMKDIDKSKILIEKWWHQLGHRWQHYVKVVPWVMFMQGSNSTWYAGAWELVNMHEAAIVAGHSVAWRLGAEYPFPEDKFALDFFKFFCLLNHGKFYSQPKVKSS